MPSRIDRPLRALAAGGVIVYPTDTLLGLGARATDPAAVAHLFALKGRPGGVPISIAVSSYDELERWAELAPPARAWVRRALPGPFTVLARASPRARRSLAPGIVGPGGTIGLRIPDHATARALARAAGPLTATSANRHGAPPCRRIAQARRAFGAEDAANVPAAPAPSGRPSTIVDWTGGRPRFAERR